MLRSSNPILSKQDAFTPAATQYGQNQYGQIPYGRTSTGRRPTSPTPASRR